ncbi:MULTISPECIES: nucleotidyltransferase domain-containing protein [unclassified Clostridium]|uniref:nucleotidyltransferase domain-containing protein n=1 Tax=unclassified Clostridium TaxID=2614128 RepID=UPI0013F05B72|nr:MULTISPECIES: nucleotidyltransferase domain-containing protein [unclassified Clostridium]NFG61201.1 nucleotidyltransferase domain-containing protein [Clostridium botulinum]NFQ08947.1 nucleotidyltransferase domain-containing protein [Clostridium botulinum]
MEFGLKEFDLKYIIEKISNFQEIEEAIIFGSRAKGNYKPGSDVDLAIIGEKITFDTLSQLHSLLEDESPMPYFFDILDYTHLNHDDLIDHINRVGKVIYKKDVE